jgi:Flp pilus assembly protein TadD
LSALKGTQARPSPSPDRSSAAAGSPAPWLLAAALVVAVLLVYQPAWRGGFLWDDDGHVTRPELRSWDGLYRIWFQLGATQQYYPLLHSAFWMEHKLWGDAPLGYHLVNILLHAAAAVLVALLLRRLRVPGAYLAAAVFALHPVHVESVAWITEQKNTLSAVWYLIAMLVYLRFDQERKISLYCGALALFVLGLLSKTTAATLPAALLVIFWWQRGRLSWRRDVGPFVPFFLLGAAAGLFTAWVERTLIGAEGQDFALTMLQRCLLAGRVIWFYLGKLLWPADLIFIYPHWDVSQVVWWQFLFPAAALLVLAGLWALRRRWRGPLAGFLFFVGTLFPVLGFCNVYPFVFSFVADHFQYLASLGVITLVSAGMMLLLEHWTPGRPWVRYPACLLLLAVLGALTWRQSRMYADVETLYRVTLARNPDCWLFHNNLGILLRDRQRFDEAVTEFRHALTIRPKYANAHTNLADAMGALGQIEEAMAEYQKALEIKPEDVGAHTNYGYILTTLGRLDEAMAQYRKALEIKPASAELQNDVAFCLAAQGRLDDAAAHYGKALDLRPDYETAHHGLGRVLAAQGRFPEALSQFHQALQIDPDDSEAQKNLAWLQATCPLASLRNGGEAIEHARRADQLCGGKRVDVLDVLAAAYAEAGRFPDALATARKALDLATRHKAIAVADVLRKRIALYEAGKPLHPPPPKGATR